MELNEAICVRRSVRKYTDVPVNRETLEKILRAGLLAPSGKNGQPWKFVAVQKDKRLLGDIAAQTVYGAFVRKADCLLCVFLDKTQSYHYIKDVQAIGACIENMLLTAADLGVGACWIGEILNRDTEVKRLLGIGNALDLMAVIALGDPDDAEHSPKKKTLRDCMLAWK